MSKCYFYKKTLIPRNGLVTATNCFGIDRSKRYRTSSEQMKTERNELFGIITYSEWEPDQKCSKIWFLFSYFLWFMQINPALRTFPFEADWSKSALEWTVESYESFTKVESERSSKVNDLQSKSTIGIGLWPFRTRGPGNHTCDRRLSVWLERLHFGNSIKVRGFRICAGKYRTNIEAAFQRKIWCHAIRFRWVSPLSPE